MAAVLAATLVVSQAAPAAPAGTARAALASEPFADQQWALRRIEAEAAWQVTRGAGAVVGVVDTGVDLVHEELAGGTLAGSTTCVGTGGAAARCAGSGQDDHGHGTHVAGVAAAPLNGRGVAGVAPEARLLSVKALDARGEGDARDVAAAVDWLVARGAHVVNLSLAGAGGLGRIAGTPIEDAIRRGWEDRGVVFVLAAGNAEHHHDDHGRGDLPALVVTATGPEDRLASYALPLDAARWGLAAPGGDGGHSSPARKVVSSFWFADLPGEHYAYSQGTSVAAPHVAGVAALLAARGVRGQAAVDAILGTLDPAACGPGCGGRLNARRALGAPPLPPPAPPTSETRPAQAGRSGTAPPATTAPGVTGTADDGQPAPSADPGGSVPGGPDPEPRPGASPDGSGPTATARPSPAAWPADGQDGPGGASRALAAAAAVLLVAVAAAAAAAARTYSRRRTVTTLP